MNVDELRPLFLKATLVVIDQQRMPEYRYQSRLADAIGMNREVFYRHMRGEVEFTRDELFEIIEKLKLPLQSRFWELVEAEVRKMLVEQGQDPNRFLPPGPIAD